MCSSFSFCSNTKTAVKLRRNVLQFDKNLGVHKEDSDSVSYFESFPIKWWKNRAVIVRRSRKKRKRNVGSQSEWNAKLHKFESQLL